MAVAQVLGGRYELMDRLGAGGMAAVWRARDAVLGRTVAVKVLAGRHAGRPESGQQIRAEARAAAMLSHPNIAQVYDYGEFDDHGVRTPYVVMELVRGDTLQRRLMSGPLAARFAMRVAAEVAAALAAAHADGLVHRDIKPANVMITPDGAKVVDFGIAAPTAPSGSAGSSAEVLGTPAYVAPERLIDDAVAPASDVYALGVLLYQMLSGQSPWSVETTTQMLAAHIYIEPAPLPQLPGVPDYVTVLCNRCLSKDPTVRPSARECAALLAHGAGMRVVADEPAWTASVAESDHEPSILVRSDAAAVASADLGPGAETPEAAAAEIPPAAAAEIPQTAAAEVPPPVAAEAPLVVAAEAPAAATESQTASRRNRRRAVAAGIAGLALGAAALLWLALGDGGDDRGSALPAEHGPALWVTPTAGGAASTPGKPASPGTRAPDGARPTPRVQGAGLTARPGTPGPIGPGPEPTSPADRPTPTITSDPPPQVRTFSSTGGSIRAVCPTAATAQILSATPVKPYKTKKVSAGPSAAPVAVFKHGNDRVRMTVTCSGGVPSSTNDEI